MSNNIAGNDRALCSLLNLENGQPGTEAEKCSLVEVMQKDDSVPETGTKADSEQKVEDIFAISNDTKPNVVGSQCQGTLIEPPTDEQRLYKIENALSGLTVEDAQYLLRKVSKSLNSKSLFSA